MDITSTANNLLHKHGLAQKGWVFKLDTATRRAGCCSYRKKTISLSKHYVNLNLAERPDDVLDTILHEIAHALSPSRGHGPEWKAVCLQIGARPNRCYDSNTIEMPKGRFAATCGGCRKTFSRHRKIDKHKKVWCASCGPDNGQLKFVDTVQTEPTSTVTTGYIPPPIRKLRGA